MHRERTTLSKFLIQHLHADEAQSQLAALLVDVAAAVKAISAMTAKGALGGYQAPAGAPHGEGVRKIDLMARDAMLHACEWDGLLGGLAGKSIARPHALPQGQPRGPYLLLFDALDGGGHCDVNLPAGTLFSILRHDGGGDAAPSDFLQGGRRQLAAGYAIYGPSTILVLTVGEGTHGFTLDREIGNFVLTHPSLRVPEDADEFTVDAGHARHWEQPVQRYVTECQAGRSGERARDFSLRGVSSVVADVHRILIRGGLYLAPGDGARGGRLHLLHEANPLALLIEQAGGRVSTGRAPVLDIEPVAMDQRVPLVLGSRHEVARVERYHAEHDAGLSQPFVSPLFNERSLFRPEQPA